METLKRQAQHPCPAYLMRPQGRMRTATFCGTTPNWIVDGIRQIIPGSQASTVNRDVRSQYMPMAAGGCYLLLAAVVLLCAVGGTVARGSVSRQSENTTTAPLVSQTSTPSADHATVTANSNVLSADAADGGRLFNTFQPAAGIACSTCHRSNSEARLVGPGLLNVARRAGATVKGMGAVAYLRESIVNPSVYVVAGYSDIMPRNWGRIFSEKQVDDLIAYLMTLQGD